MSFWKTTDGDGHEADLALRYAHLVRLVVGCPGDRPPERCGVCKAEVAAGAVDADVYLFCRRGGQAEWKDKPYRAACPWKDDPE